MLKYFHAYEVRSDTGIPYCKALLCVGKVPSKLLAYVNRLCDTSHTSQDDLLTALHQHLIAKAEEKLYKRQKWYASQKRKYTTSHYATIDAALASEPRYPLEQLPARLHAEREAIPFSMTKSMTELFEELGDKKQWTWEDYEEVGNMLELLEAHALEVPHTTIALKRGSAKRLDRMLKRGSVRTPKARLVRLIEMANAIPQMFIMVHHRAQVARWIIDNPPPLKNETAQRIAKLPRDEYGQLLADQMTWLHLWYRFMGPKRNAGLSYVEHCKVFQWEDDKLVEYPIEEEFDTEVVAWSNREWAK